MDDLVRTINDDWDILHADYTPSVHKLIKLGAPVMPRMLDLMLSGDEDTRIHAQRVLEGIMLGRYGFVVGRGWQNPADEEQFRVFWKSLGDLDWTRSLEERERAVKAWRVWLEKQKA